jgi:CDGSH-type Zn-finger protein
MSQPSSGATPSGPARSDPPSSGPAPSGTASSGTPAGGSTRVTIKVRKNGSLLVTGDFDLVNHEGVPIPRPSDKPNVALCRCGHSQRKPFCDGSHKTCGFVDPPDVPASAPPE